MSEKKKYFLYEDGDFIKIGKRGVHDKYEDVTSKYEEQFGEFDLEEAVAKQDKKNAKFVKMIDDNDVLFGYVFKLNQHVDDDIDDSRVAIIFTCDVEEFLDEHPGIKRKLMEKYGKVTWVQESCPANRPLKKKRKQSAFQVVPNRDGEDYGKEEIPYIPQVTDDAAREKAYAKWVQDGNNPEDFVYNKKKSVSEKIKRSGLMDTLRANFGVFSNKVTSDYSENDPKIKKILESKSLPPIIFDDEKYTNLKVDHKFDNDRIQITTHSFLSFEQAEDWFKYIIDNTRGKTSSYSGKVDYIARQFNKKQKGKGAWGINRMMSGFDIEKIDTAILNLDERGIPKPDFTRAVMSTTHLLGVREGDNFTWKIKYDVAIAKKLANGEVDIDDSDMFERIAPYSISINETVTLPKGLVLGDDEPIIEVRAVRLGLKKLCDDFAEQLNGLDPKQLMKVSQVLKSDRDANIKLIEDIESGKVILPKKLADKKNKENENAE